MQDFGGGSDVYGASIAVDASTIGNVTTGVAVYATRSDEIEILDSIRAAARATSADFIPFKSKSTHFDREDDSEFYERVVRTHSERIQALHFEHHSAQRNQHYVEAVISAILVSEVTASVETDTCVIIDGDRNKVDDFVGAYRGFSTATVPPVTNSYQAEIYYPHTLLADLSAGLFADRIASGSYDYTDPLVRCPPVDQRCADRWGRAFSNLQRGETPPYTRLGAETMRGNTERDRATIWFAGLMGRSPSSRMSTPSLGSVATYLRDEGYESLAARLEVL